MIVADPQGIFRPAAQASSNMLNKYDYFINKLIIFNHTLLN